MDFCRYAKETFHENKIIDKSSKEYQKLDTHMRYIRETYPCFNQNLKNEIYLTKRLIKKNINTSHAITKDTHFSKRNVISCLNKLTSSNYVNIYKKIMLSIQVNDSNDIINTIISTCLDSKAYHELYTGLIIHMYEFGNQDIKKIIVDQINETFCVLFNTDKFTMIIKKEENYDDFCDRMNSKTKTIHTVYVYILFHFHDNLSNNLYKTPQQLVDFLFLMMKDVMKDETQNHKTIELILLCIKECYEIKDPLKIPSTEKECLSWKKLISLDSNLNNELNIFLTKCNSSKLKFIVLDLLDTLHKQF